MSVDSSRRIRPADAGYVRQRAAALVERASERVEILRAAPVWDGPEALVEAGFTVRVRACVSALAVLDAYEQLGAEDYLVVLTDRDAHDLGDTILLRARGHRPHVIDPWSAVPEMFGARTADRDLRARGSWVPEALLSQRPSPGWPAAPAGTVTEAHALSNLLSHVLGMRLPTTLDEGSLLLRLDTPEGRLAWQSTSPTLRDGLAGWAGDGLGAAAELALRIAAAQQVSVCGVGLALDVVWPRPEDHAVVTEDQKAARIRAEAKIHPAANGIRSRALADAARLIATRHEDSGDAALGVALDAAEAVLGDLQWADGAERSDWLATGLRARLRHLTEHIRANLLMNPAGAGPESQLAELLEHRLARRNAREIVAAQMAVRLVRWLGSPDGAGRPPAGSLTEALHIQVDDGAWVDHALAAVHTGSAFPEVALVYGELVTRVRGQRRERDAMAAALLARATADDQPLDDVVPLEDLRQRVVVPVAKATGTLVVVVDGMSAAVATEIVDSGLARTWTELLPANSARRAVGLAVLPSMTTYSRTSLFAGALQTGTQDAEKKRWRDDLGAAIFHKEQLQTVAGAMLPASLVEALEGPDRVIGVVLNTVDDALKSADPGGTAWTDETVRYLAPLLNAAYIAGRTVILTSDHGHVIERGGALRNYAGSDARWRTADSVAADGEVLVAGRRVLTPGGRAVLAWDEDIRFGKRSAGYHGGASLAEITVPIIVLAPTPDAEIAGWRAGPPQMPSWWNDPVIARPDPSVGGRRALRAGPVVVSDPPAARSSKLRRDAEDAGQGMLGFDVADPVTPKPVDAESALVDALLQSPTYAEQRRHSGRHPLDDGVVQAFVLGAIRRGGRAHRYTLAAEAGVATPLVAGTIVSLRRLLNVDMYPVIKEDEDGVTLVLDAALLRQQFDLGS
ncbi:BREX-2 system phosphatase PglZ [Cellulomonas humilata]|uniref:BREX-2 system phosphatase PglZ n=1 Tax=Cellulomonas humilata TaxID=144055 RepID=A0A7Y6A284_9CELL|nr:BREX-2 system phosphatase PglZ [Cellulomonas humilata]NUU18464.1 BREX-2 system phosphatase PglZ [Cellulomonas humilata]